MLWPLKIEKLDDLLILINHGAQLVTNSRPVLYHHLIIISDSTLLQLFHVGKLPECSVKRQKCR